MIYYLIYMFIYLDKTVKFYVPSSPMFVLSQILELDDATAGNFRIYSILAIILLRLSWVRALLGHDFFLFNIEPVYRPFLEVLQHTILTIRYFQDNISETYELIFHISFFRRYISTMKVRYWMKNSIMAGKNKKLCYDHTIISSRDLHTPTVCCLDRGKNASVWRVPGSSGYAQNSKAPPLL